MAQLNDYQRLEIKKRAAQMPVFPQTDENGDPLIGKHFFFGWELKKMAKEDKYHGRVIKRLKRLNDKERYGPFTGFIDRVPEKILRDAFKQIDVNPDAVSEVYLKYMKEYAIYQKRLLYHEEQHRNVKTENNENEKIKNIYVDEHSPLRYVDLESKLPGTADEEGHGSSVDPIGDK